MTTYKEIFGKPVKFLGTDPDNTEAEGQIWYNSTSGSFKSVVQVEAWSSGSPLITTRSSLGGTGTQTAALVTGGNNPTPTTIAATEEYNGSGWSTGGNLNNATSDAGTAGTQTAAVNATGGTIGPLTIITNTEEYDGSTWTSVNPTNTGLYTTGSSGTQTAALIFGGRDPGASYANNTESYDGTSWTAENTLNTGRRYIGGCGTTSPVSLAFGGRTAPTDYTTFVEEYDGTSWAAGTNLPTGRRSQQGVGSNSDALVFGGQTPPTGASTTETLNYDGTTWTTSPVSLATAIQKGGQAGNVTAALVAGGSTGPANVAVTEEYNKSASVITPGAWASGGNMNTGRFFLAGTNAPGSTANALLGFGGYGTPPTTPSAETESYDGSSWTTETNLPAAASRNFGTGTLTAALQAGGLSPPTTNLSASNEWNGSAWTATNPINEARGQSGSFGVQTASVIVGGARFFGSPPPADIRSTVEEYDGTSWAAGTATPVATRNRGGAGILTAGIAWAGLNSPDGSWPGSTTNETLLYDGTSWTTGGNFNNPSPNNFTGGGTQTAAWSARHPNASHEQYNGTTWATAPSTSSSAGNARSGSGQTSAVVFAGFTGTVPTTATEEFTGETSALNFKTLTTS